LDPRPLDEKSLLGERWAVLVPLNRRTSFITQRNKDVAYSFRYRSSI